MIACVMSAIGEDSESAAAPVKADEPAKSASPDPVDTNEEEGDATAPVDADAKDAETDSKDTEASPKDADGDSKDTEADSTKDTKAEVKETKADTKEAKADAKEADSEKNGTKSKGTTTPV